MNTTEWVKAKEGLTLTLKKDTRGYTVGYGRNLLTRGITQAEAEQMLRDDLQELTLELGKLEWFDHLNTPARMTAILDMAYNIGMHGLLGFKNMLDAVSREDWAGAAQAALDSMWATQVGDRAVEDAQMLRSGEYLTEDIG